MVEAMPPPVPTVGAVVLSMGTRPQELAQALQTLLRQTRVDLDILVVGNGWRPMGLPPGVRTLTLAENVGIPEGRNIGARAVKGEVIFFYDDDAWLPTGDVLSRLVCVLLADSVTAIVQPCATDPTGLPSPRRWIPRLNVRDGGRGGLTCVFWEGVFAIRRSAFDQVGGWPGHFFYGHEGIDLAWRLTDANWLIRYVPQIEVHHPATSPTRHAVYYRMNARNRVWLARRNLPWPLAVIHLTAWVCITVIRVRNAQRLAVWFRGFYEGLTTDCGQRQPMRWRTAWGMLRKGRPPVI